MLEQLKHARRVSVPLVAVQTPDPAATMRTIAEGLNGKPSPVVAWDIVRGTWAVNDGGQEVAATTGNGDDDNTISQPVEFLNYATKFPEGTVAFMSNAHDWLHEPPVRQGIWNLRDQYKRDRRMLILLGPTIELPASLKDDVVMFDEALPDADALGEIVRAQDAAANVCQNCGGGGTNAGLECTECGGSGRSKRKSANKAVVAKAVAATQGLSAFAAEQSVAMSLRTKGIDLDHLWESKRQQIEQTKGLAVWRGGETFADVGGLDNAKDFLQRIIAGKRQYDAVVWLDEIEKMVAGSEGDLSDSSGVSQGILQALLGHMQDHDARGMILLGPPGTGKSLLAKATGGHADIPTIAWDSNAMKGGIVGESESNVRTALKVVSAVSNDHSLWIATCNSIRGIPTALRRRFSYGTYFVDLPDSIERKAIWKYYLAKNGIDGGDDTLALSNGWTGAEIKTCAELAWELECPLSDAARHVVPVSRAMPEKIDELRKEAHGRYLSASYPAVYDRDGRGDVGEGRQIEL